MAEGLRNSEVMRRRCDLGDGHTLRFPPAHTQHDTRRQVPIATHTVGFTQTHMQGTSKDAQVRHTHP